MAQDLLLEIGVEEMPSAYMPGAVRDLQELAQQLLGDARLEWKELKVYATPAGWYCMLSSWPNSKGMQ